MTTQNGEMRNLRLAVLIDADNVPRDCLKSILEEIAVYGTPTIKRIYGDWSSSTVKGWKDSLLENAVTPVQQYAYAKGKNATDSAIIIDAMDILYAGRTDGFVLVSSDSDFVPLVSRLKESAMEVYGIGESKTPDSFRNACTKFILIENIKKRAQKTEEPAPAKPAKTTARKKTAGDKDKKSAEKQPVPAPAAQPQDKRVPENVVALIADSVADIADDDGFADLSSLGNLIIKKQPDFDPRSYGFGKLSKMLKSMPRFQVNERQSPGDPLSKLMFIKDLEG